MNMGTWIVDGSGLPAKGQQFWIKKTKKFERTFLKEEGMEGAAAHQKGKDKKQIETFFLNT
jgi:hypothetical protein